jgi:hypothetical protein
MKSHDSVHAGTVGLQLGLGATGALSARLQQNSVTSEKDWCPHFSGGEAIFLVMCERVEVIQGRGVRQVLAQGFQSAGHVVVRVSRVLSVSRKNVRFWSQCFSPHLTPMPSTVSSLRVPSVP